ncbi:zinc finger protein 862-like [Lytechinus pictus]|uniref:zinc finger protein 862-like n=1 Tax=Lytechinus pictus TaxID=7653 RepID=UPI0030B9D132
MVQAQEGETVDAKSKAKGYMRQLQRKNILTFMLFLYDVVVVLSKISLKAQISSSTVADVAASIHAAETALGMYKERKSTPSMLEFETYFQSEDLTASLSGSTNIETHLTKMLEGLKNRLEGRFDDMQNGVCKALKIASFNLWPEDDKLQDYGNEEVKTLAGHFRRGLAAAGVDTTKVGVEWELLKARLNSKSDLNNFKKNSLPWSSIIPTVKEELPNICAILDLVLTIPASSAEAERGFSRLKNLKTTMRTCLKDDRVTDQLLIMLHSEEISSFDPHPAISLWHAGGMRARRPEYHRRRCHASSAASCSGNHDSDSEQEFEAEYSSDHGGSYIGDIQSDDHHDDFESDSD